MIFSVISFCIFCVINFFNFLDQNIRLNQIRIILFSSVLHLFSANFVQLLSISLPKKESLLHRTRLLCFFSFFFLLKHEYIIDCEKSNWRFNRARHLYPAVPFLDPFFFSFLLPRISSYSHVFTVSMHDPSIIFRSMYSIPLCRLS